MKYTYLRKWIDLLDLYGNEFSFQELDPTQVMYVCHELLHVKFPTVSESKIVELTNLFMGVNAPTRD